MKRAFLGLKILIATLTISALLVGVYKLASGPIFRVHEVVVTLDDRASHDQMFVKIKEALDLRLQPLNNKYIWSLDLENILSKVESDLRIKSAQVSRVLPDKIKISVLPHTPIAVVMGDQSNKVYPISRSGDLLLPINSEEMHEGPVLRGQEFIRDKEKRLAAIQILLALPETGILSQNRVSEIFYDRKKGYLIYLAPTGVEVWLGQEDFPRRLSQATRVLQYLEQEELSGRIIDARFTKKVVVRLRNEP